jgi:glucose-6-phosphate 1-dehydrogenase
MREDSVELAWSVLTPVLETIESANRAPLATYAAGSNGPGEAVRMIEKDGRAWRPL